MAAACADADALHVTLAFLGTGRPARPERAIAALVGAGRARVAAAGARARRRALLLPPRRARACSPRGAGRTRARRARGAAGARRRRRSPTAGALRRPSARPFRAARHGRAAARRCARRRGRRRRPSPSRSPFAGDGADALPLAPGARRRPLRARSSGSRSAELGAHRPAALRGVMPRASSRAGWPGSARVRRSALSPPLLAVLALPGASWAVTWRSCRIATGVGVRARCSVPLDRTGALPGTVPLQARAAARRHGAAHARSTSPAAPAAPGSRRCWR